MRHARAFLRWYLITSAIVGAPVLAFVLIVALQRSFFTLTCEVTCYRCERSYTHSVEWIAEQVDEDTDVVVRPSRKK